MFLRKETYGYNAGYLVSCHEELGQKLYQYNSEIVLCDCVFPPVSIVIMVVVIVPYYYYDLKLKITLMNKY